MTVRENSTSYSMKEKHIKNKEVYIDESKSTGRKVGFAAGFADITRRRALLEEASFHAGKVTAVKTIPKEIYLRVPQVGVLSESLSLVATNDILSELGNRVGEILFADYYF